MSSAAAGSPRLLSLVRRLPKPPCLLGAFYSQTLLERSSCTNRYDSCFQQYTPHRNYVSWIRSPSVVNINGYSHNNGSGGSERYRSKGREVGETTIMHQEGNEIQEVPLAVLKADPHRDKDSGGKLSAKKSYIELDHREEAAFVEAFNSYHTPQEILKILNTIPSQEVTPFVSLSILKKLFELENNFLFRNDGRSWVITAENSTIGTFARMAIVSRLIDTIVSSDDPNIILDALDTLRSERSTDSGEQDGSPVAAENSSNYRNKVFEEVLVRVTEGKFSVDQVCRAVVCLGKMEIERGKPLHHDFIDKLWIGMSDKSGEINVENIVEVFRVIQYFKKSRRLVLNLAEKRLLAVWWKIDATVVSKICSILVSDDETAAFVGNIKLKNRNYTNESLGVSKRLLLALARCASLNIHQVKEEELLMIVKAFYTLDFCDESFEKALNKYMKTKCLKISNSQLVAEILDYARKFQIRSANILDAAAEYVVLHKGANLSPPQVTSIVTAYGHLDFQPPNGIKFWQVIEGFLDEKFIQFPPKDMVDVMLSCVYLLKFPLNFVDRIFSPYFLDRLHTSESDYNLLQNMRSRLKLLDAALTIECSLKYGGPMLPKDFTSRSIFVDGRILRMANIVEESLRTIVRTNAIVEKSMVLPSLPLNALYIADIHISTSDSDRHTYLRNRISARLNTGIASLDNPRDLTVILIHIPEYYSRGGSHLIGQEVMRIRHLKTLGFRIVVLKYDTLAELKVHPEGFRDYLKDRLSDAGYNLA